MSMIYVLKSASEETIDGLLAAPSRITQFLDDAEGEGDFSLDKSWHGIHYLLTGSDWEGELPAAFLILGGAVVGDIDVGYGPARCFTPAETLEIHQCLSLLDEAQLRDAFDPAEMSSLGIYPTTWMDAPEDELNWLLSYFEELKQFLADTAGRNMGMVVYVS